MSDPLPPATPKKRIAILGGGMAALTSAFELTRVPGWKREYEITIYQMGWRLGGKGASGRNHDRYDRIEEHGLHLFFGFYENACRVLRDCYRELGRDPAAPLATWEDAFKAHDLIVFEERIGDGWEPWAVTFPRTHGLPGDPPTVLPTPWRYLELLLGWLTGLLEGSGLLPFGGLGWASLRATIRRDVLPAGLVDPAAAHSTLAAAFHGALASLGGVVDALRPAAGHLHVAHELVATLPPDPTLHDEGHHGAIVRLLRGYRTWLESQVGHLLDGHRALRHLYILSDLGIACAIGLIEDGIVLPPYDWFAIDDVDFRTWVMRHGAARRSAYSAPINTLYALAFAETTDVGAGTAVHGILRLCFTYRGALIWEMQAGMGETVFAPLYLVLARRGVRFRFFHRVDRLVLDATRTRVARIEMGQQVTVKGGAAYRPLVDVDGLPCWPSRPDRDQLDQGAALGPEHDLEDWWTTWPDAGPPVVLEEGRDFDLVVLGISIATFPDVCGELMEQHPPLADMVAKVRTTQTQAVQLWFAPDLAGLGWPTPPPAVGSYALPFDTWADLSHLVAREKWPATFRPRNLAYLCGCMDDYEPLPPRTDHGYTARQAGRVRRNAVEWLEQQAPALWPAAVVPGVPPRFAWSALVDPEGGEGQARLEAQYWRATVSPSERYVLSVPGSTRYRLAADESGFANLYLAGDYTFTAINAGCIEAATISGMHVSRAIAGWPAVIVGDIPKRRPGDG